MTDDKLPDAGLSCRGLGSQTYVEFVRLSSTKPLHLLILYLFYVSIYLSRCVNNAPESVPCRPMKKKDVHRFPVARLTVAQLRAGRGRLL